MFSVVEDGPDFEVHGFQGGKRALDVTEPFVEIRGHGTYFLHTPHANRSRVPGFQWETWDDLHKYVVLRHEAVHLRQFRRYTFLGMAFLYLVPLLPMGLAAGRAFLEWKAYKETLTAIAECRGIAAASDPVLHAHIVKQFCSGAYGFMWPFPKAINRWIGAHVNTLEAAKIAPH